MHVYQRMRNSFCLDERIWRYGAVKLMRRMNPDIPGFVEHERIAGNEEEASACMLLRIVIASETTAAEPCDACRHCGERDSLVGVHRSGQLREMDGNGVDHPRIWRELT